MKSIYDVIKHPRVTEKSTIMQGQNKYVFVVDYNANKIEVQKAIEEIYNVKVKKINTSKIKSKKKRVRFAVGETAEQKKAIVTLEAGYEIELV